MKNRFKKALWILGGAGIGYLLEHYDHWKERKKLRGCGVGICVTVDRNKDIDHELNSDALLWQELSAHGLVNHGDRLAKGDVEDPNQVRYYYIFDTVENTRLATITFERFFELPKLKEYAKNETEPRIQVLFLENWKGA